MYRLMTYETLDYYAYSNDTEIQGEIKGIIVEFYGLYNQQKLNDYDGPLAEFLSDSIGDSYRNHAHDFAKDGIIYIVPFCNPWNWMNRHTVSYVDEIIDVMLKHYQISNPRIVYSGRSMGGYNSLVYSRMAKHSPIGCIAGFPVCDLPYHYYEREDLPRTLWSAFGYYDCTLEEALLTTSPLHHVTEMPKIPYIFYQGDADMLVSKAHHSDKMVAALRENGFDVTYHVMSGCGHCEFSSEDKLDEYFQNGKKFILG